MNDLGIIARVMQSAAETLAYDWREHGSMRAADKRDKGGDGHDYWTRLEIKGSKDHNFVLRPEAFARVKKFHSRANINLAKQGTYEAARADEKASEVVTPAVFAAEGLYIMQWLIMSLGKYMKALAEREARIAELENERKETDE